MQHPGGDRWLGFKKGAKILVTTAMASSYEESQSDESQHSLTSSIRSNSKDGKSNKWTKEEDASLKFLVEQHGM